MLVAAQERYGYDEYDRSEREERFARNVYEDRYEEERDRTSSAYRDSLMDSLVRPATHSRLERSDADRYGFYIANIQAGENNYDRFYDRKQQARVAQRHGKKRLPFVVAYLAIALVAIIAVTLSVVGTDNSRQTVVEKNLAVESLSANAEVLEQGTVASAESAEENVVTGGENYILLSSGELVAIDVPEQYRNTGEEEKGFDKFCSWLNGVFGG